MKHKHKKMITKVGVNMFQIVRRKSLKAVGPIDANHHNYPDSEMYSGHRKADNGSEAMRNHPPIETKTNRSGAVVSIDDDMSLGSSLGTSSFDFGDYIIDPWEVCPQAAPIYCKVTREAAYSTARNNDFQATEIAERIKKLTSKRPDENNQIIDDSMRNSRDTSVSRRCNSGGRKEIKQTLHLSVSNDEASAITVPSSNVKSARDGRKKQIGVGSKKAKGKQAKKPTERSKPGAISRLNPPPPPPKRPPSRSRNHVQSTKIKPPSTPREYFNTSSTSFSSNDLAKTARQPAKILPFPPKRAQPLRTLNDAQNAKVRTPSPPSEDFNTPLTSFSSGDASKTHSFGVQSEEFNASLNSLSSGGRKSVDNSFSVSMPNVHTNVSYHPSQANVTVLQDDGDIKPSLNSSERSGLSLNKPVSKEDEIRDFRQVNKSFTYGERNSSNIRDVKKGHRSFTIEEKNPINLDYMNKPQMIPGLRRSVGSQNDLSSSHLARIRVNISRAPVNHSLRNDHQKQISADSIHIEPKPIASKTERPAPVQSFCVDFEKKQKKMSRQASDIDTNSETVMKSPGQDLHVNKNEKGVAKKSRVPPLSKQFDFEKTTGRCINHPQIIMARKKPFAKGWDMVRHECPLCADAKPHDEHVANKVSSRASSRSRHQEERVIVGADRSRSLSEGPVKNDLNVVSFQTIQGVDEFFASSRMFHESNLKGSAPEVKRRQGERSIVNCRGGIDAKKIKSLELIESTDALIEYDTSGAQHDDLQSRLPPASSAPTRRHISESSGLDSRLVFNESTGANGCHVVSKMPFTTPWGDAGWYSGEVNESGKPNGKGRMSFKNGNMHEGMWANGYSDQYLESSDLMTRGFIQKPGSWEQGPSTNNGVHYHRNQGHHKFDVYTPMLYPTNQYQFHPMQYYQSN